MMTAIEDHNHALTSPFVPRSFRTRRARRASPTRLREAAPRAEGQTRDSDFARRRDEPHRLVRPQTGTREAPRPAARQRLEAGRVLQSGGAVAKTGLGVQEARKKRVVGIGT